MKAGDETECIFSYSGSPHVRKRRQMITEKALLGSVFIFYDPVFRIPLNAGMILRDDQSNFLSYSSAAISTTKQDPALCTSAPVTGVSISRRMLNFIVFTVALDSLFR